MPAKHKHIFLDRTRVSVVISCRDCGIWSTMRFTDLEAWEAAAAHEERAHPEQTQARDALFALRRRLAERAQHAAATA